MEIEFSLENNLRKLLENLHKNTLEVTLSLQQVTKQFARFLHHDSSQLEQSYSLILPYLDDLVKSIS